MHGGQRRAEPRIDRSPVPAGCIGAPLETGAYGQHHQDVQEPVEHRLLAGRGGGELTGQQGNDGVQGVVGGCGQRKDRGKRLDQASADVTREPVRTAQEHARARIGGGIIAHMVCPELLWRLAGGGGLVSDVVVGAAPDERHVAGCKFERGLRVIEPQPRPSLDDGMHRQLDGAGQPQAPRRLGHRPGKDAAAGTGPGEVILQNVHDMSVLLNEASVKHIASLIVRSQDRVMANTPSNTLVLGGSGKTGSRVAARLTRLGLGVRTAARNGADVRFDWDDPATYRPALEDTGRVYLVAPVMRTDFADQVSNFLDLAEAAGVRHVTYLSAFGIDQAPPQVAHRAVELDLMGRGAVTHSILRPAWFMQNFSETFLKPADAVITVPTGDGAEAFVDAEDIAAVAAATLASPGAHAGAQYAPTGPEALTVSDAAAIIADVTGHPVKHDDIDRQAWLDGSVAAGVPAEYGEVLRMLTETMASGHGSQPNSDVQSVTGAPPVTFASFARRTAQAWA
jgi:uncharacterized protein YbjT (DUF2867 family)